MVESAAMRSVLLLVLAGCGGAAPPPPAGSASPAPALAAPVPAPKAAPVGEAAPPPSASAATASPTYDDPGEAGDPATLTPLFEKGAKVTFPKPAVSEKDCWQTVSLVGDARKDFDNLVAKCGAPTGAVEYVKPAAGRLHSVKDKRDTFLVKVHGGLCYRFLGVADGTIKDLDILILKGNSDLVGQDKVDGTVSIIDSDKAWCMDTDGDYQFRVEIDGAGEGHYVFGVWARPKK